MPLINMFPFDSWSLILPLYIHRTLVPAIGPNRMKQFLLITEQLCSCWCWCGWQDDPDQAWWDDWSLCILPNNWTRLFQEQLDLYWQPGVQTIWKKDIHNIMSLISINQWRCVCMGCGHMVTVSRYSTCIQQLHRKSSCRQMLNTLVYTMIAIMCTHIYALNPPIVLQFQDKSKNSMAAFKIQIKYMQYPYMDNFSSTVYILLWTQIL